MKKWVLRIASSPADGHCYVERNRASTRATYDPHRPVPSEAFATSPSSISNRNGVFDLHAKLILLLHDLSLPLQCLLLLLSEFSLLLPHFLFTTPSIRFLEVLLPYHFVLLLLLFDAFMLLLHRLLL